MSIRYWAILEQIIYQPLFVGLSGIEAMMEQIVVHSFTGLDNIFWLNTQCLNSKPNVFDCSNDLNSELLVV